MRTKAAFHELIWRLAGDGMAILLITSDLPETATLAGRIAVMYEFGIVGTVPNNHSCPQISQAVIGLVRQTG